MALRGGGWGNMQAFKEKRKRERRRFARSNCHLACIFKGPFTSGGERGEGKQGGMNDFLPLKAEGAGGTPYYRTELFEGRAGNGCRSFYTLSSIARVKKESRVTERGGRGERLTGNKGNPLRMLPVGT